MKIAVFDVCGTLYDSNTTFDFLDDFFKDSKKYNLFRKISSSLFWKIVNYPFYRFFKFDITRNIATYFLKGYTKKELNIATKIFVYGKLEGKIKIDIYDLLKTYKEKGFIIILMSGSYSPIIDHISTYMDADYFFASQLEIVNDKYTGRYSVDQLFNKKEVLLKNFTNISELVVASDNKTDYELMKIANKGYAIANNKKQILFWKSKKIPYVEIVSYNV